MPPTDSPVTSVPPAALAVGGRHAGAGRVVRLRVRDIEGRVRAIEVHADSESAAIRKLASKGFTVLSIDALREPSGVALGTAPHGRFMLLLFTQELLALLDAGLHLTEALQTLHAKERNPAARALLLDMVMALREGRNFSDVLADRPQHFPEIYAATVRASERTGDLPRALARYVSYQLQFDALRKKLVSAAIYPAMLLLVGSCVSLFLLGYVVPRFSSVYETTGQDIPWMSSVLLSFGSFLRDEWRAATATCVAVLGALAWALRLRSARAALLSLVLRAPMLAAKVDEFRLARFFRAVGLLLASGIALPRALAMVDGLLSAQQRRRLAQARAHVEQGRRLSDALGSASLSSPVADSLIRVGERSGQLGDMLERTAAFHDDDFGRWVDWTSRLLEPVLMVLIGIVIGGVVVLMYLPIFELAGSLQ